MPVHLAASYYLGCPIASMSSSYYLLSYPSDKPKEIPPPAATAVKFVDLNTDFYRINDEVKPVLIMKVFHPELSVLGTVPAILRPLIALLMEPNLFPTLPARIKVCVSDSESYTSARLRTVIKWVAETNPFRVLQAIMLSIRNSNYLDYISGIVLNFLEDFCPDFVEAFQVLKVLDMGEGVPSPVEWATNIKEDRVKECQTFPTIPLFVQTAAEFLKGTASPHQPVNFLYKWPVALVHLYRSNLLEKLFITPVYSEFGSIFDFANEYLVEFPNVFGPSRILRYGHYCLIKGVEEANGLISKLTGLRPYAIETCYEGHFRYKIYLLE
ncbi:unnamed protein product, partial [Hydatigera taeniaeformis]|uniref:BTB domain-containing protein n=1 Tax=Hydatigena taeniaeformis TaxID=6205 RepID=A0A0R3WP03_HYDTA